MFYHLFSSDFSLKIADHVIIQIRNLKIKF
jgi:hypothetical protein